MTVFRVLEGIVLEQQYIGVRQATAGAGRPFSTDTACRKSPSTVSTAVCQLPCNFELLRQPLAVAQLLLAFQPVGGCGLIATKRCFLQCLQRRKPGSGRFQFAAHFLQLVAGLSSPCRRASPIQLSGGVLQPARNLLFALLPVQFRHAPVRRDALRVHRARYVPRSSSRLVRRVSQLNLLLVEVLDTGGPPPQPHGAIRSAHR